MQKSCLILLTVLGLVSCSSSNSLYTSNGDKHYLQSRNGPKLAIPTPLTDANLSSFYDLPAQNQNAQVSIEPPKTRGDYVEKDH